LQVSIRLSGVDGENPIIDIACETGDGGDTATSPSIKSEAVRAVLIICTFRRLIVPTFEPFASIIINPLEEIRYEAFALNSFQSIANDDLVGFFESDGPSGNRDLSYSEGGPISLRASTIEIRMGTPPPPK